MDRQYGSPVGFHPGSGPSILRAAAEKIPTRSQLCPDYTSMISLVYPHNIQCWLVEWSYTPSFLVNSMVNIYIYPNGLTDIPMKSQGYLSGCIPPIYIYPKYYPHDIHISLGSISYIPTYPSYIIGGLSQFQLAG